MAFFGEDSPSTARINEYGLTYGYYRLYNEWNSRYSIVSGIDFKQTKINCFFIRLNIRKLYAVYCIFYIYSEFLII